MVPLRRKFLVASSSAFAVKAARLRPAANAVPNIIACEDLIGLLLLVGILEIVVADGEGFEAVARALELTPAVAVDVAGLLVADEGEDRTVAICPDVQRVRLTGLYLVAGLG